MSRKKKNKRKINKKRVGCFFVFLFLLFILIYKLINTNITNIYISGNKYLKDQEIIDIANLNDYPKTIKCLNLNIKNNLEKHDLILNASVKKNVFLNKVYIKITEDYPLAFYEPENKTILYSGKMVNDSFVVPTIINKIPDTIYEKFIKNMREVNLDVLYRMSQIEYKPNEVDDERFFILMNDGNYVYLTISRFLNINKYFEMIKSFNNIKGILYLDSGTYFVEFDN